MYQTSWTPRETGELLAESLIPACPPPQPGHPSCVQTKSPPTTQEGGWLSPHQGQPRVLATTQPRQASLDPAPLAGARDKTGAGSPVLTPSPVLTCHPVCLTFLSCVSGVGSARSMVFLRSSLWWACVFGALQGFGCTRVLPGAWAGAARLRLGNLLCLQPGMNVQAGQQCFALLGTSAHWVGSWITCLFFY